MAGFKQGGIEFKKKTVIGSPSTSDHIIVYWNDINDLIIKSSTGEEVIATESLLASISGNLQTQIDNLDLNYATDANLAAISGNLQAQITSNDTDISDLQTDISGISGGLTQLDNRFVNVTGDTMTGDLNVATNVTISGGMTINAPQGDNDVTIKRFIGPAGGDDAYKFDAGSDSHTFIGSTTVFGNLLGVETVSLKELVQDFAELTFIDNSDTAYAGIFGSTGGDNIGFYDYGPNATLFEINLQSSGQMGITTNPANEDVDFTIEKSSGNGSGDAYKYDSADDTHTFNSNTFLNGNITVNGNILQVSGSNITQIAETLTVEDNLIVLNSGETGSEVTLGESGVQVDRGTGDPYQFMFVEDLRNEAEVFAVGISGNLQAVATRNDSDQMVSNGIAYWNASENRLDTTSSLTDTALSGDLDSRYVNVDGDTMTGDLTLSNDLIVSNLASISGNFLTTDANGTLVDSGSNTTTLDNTYVNVTGDTMTGDLIVSANVSITGNLTIDNNVVISGGLTMPTLITDEDNVVQVNDSGDFITTEIQELYVPVEDVTGPNATGIKGQWSYGLGYYYKCIADDTWIKVAVVTSW